MPANTFLPTFSVCLCTRDHPEGLRRTLQSVAASTTPPHQLIVVDDSSNYQTRELLRHGGPDLPDLRGLPDLVYLEGPRRSGAASRNRGLRAATGSHVLFLDDRTLLGPTFLQQMADRLADDYVHRTASGCATPLILTGTDLCQGQRGKPRKAAFLGYPSLDYRHGERLCSVVLHSTVFPRALFDDVRFGEQLAAGYEVCELACRAVYEFGHRIMLVPSAVNQHAAAAAGLDDDAAPAGTASRLYVTYRHYGRCQHRPVKAALYLAVALPHMLARNVRRAGWHGTVPAWDTTRQLWALLRTGQQPQARGAEPGTSLPGSMA
ncbi:glycosyltransferase family A protein [Cupriavidus necator]|uniref:glycosyltransferase family 2 protein n=1 Tax=Cupriavidus necator TaxID=106590 RepID=UPI0039C124FF